MNLKQFQAKLDGYRKPLGQSQKNLAAILGVTPTTLSHKLNATGDKSLTQREVKIIIQTLAQWGGLTNQSQVVELLELMGLAPFCFSSAEWNSPPLSQLITDVPARLLSNSASNVNSGRASATAPPAIIPTPLTSLVGRDHELHSLLNLLHSNSSIRLLTLLGPGGVGKTRLALKVATQVVPEFRDGVYFVELAAATQPNEVISTIAKTFFLREGGNQVSLLNVIKHYLQDKKLLLVLDNFEQVLAAGKVLTELLENAAQLRIIVTSRAVLQCYGEYEFNVPPLALPNQKQLLEVSRLEQYEAIRLFMARARAVKPGFTLTNDNAKSVVEICQYLEGLPLAIELAAARIKFFSPQVILAQLTGENGNRLSFLVGGAVTLSERHQAMRYTLEWSYRLLTVEEQQLFTRLGVFIGGFSIEAVTAISEIDTTPNETTARLISLTNKSIIQCIDLPDSTNRFRMLETIREFALEKLKEIGIAETVTNKFAAYYLSWAEDQFPNLSTVNQNDTLKSLDVEYINLRAVLNDAILTGQGQTALRLGIVLRLYWETRGYYSEGQTFLEQAVKISKQATPEPDEEEWRAKALIALARLCEFQGKFSESQSYYQESLVLSRAAQNKAVTATALMGLGGTNFYQGNYNQARHYYEESLELHYILDNKINIGGILNNLGAIAVEQEEYDQAKYYLEKGVKILQELGNRRGVAYILTNLGVVAATQAEYEQASRYLKEGLTLGEEAADKYVIAEILSSLVLVGIAQSEFTQAENYLSRVVEMSSQMGSPRLMVINLIGLANLLLHRLEIETAPAYTAATLANKRLTFVAHIVGAVQGWVASGSSKLKRLELSFYYQAELALQQKLEPEVYKATLAEGSSMELIEILDKARSYIHRWYDPNK